MKLICEYCNQSFEAKNENRRFCSRRCINKAMWSNAEYKKKLKEKLKEAHNRPDVIERHRCAAKDNWKNENFRTSLIKTMNSDETKNKKNESMKKTLAKPDILQKYSDSKKMLWKQESYREKQINTIKERWADPEYKNRQSELIKERWADPEYADKHIKSLYKYKDFVLPSGKIIKLQGYEPLVLIELLKKYEEADIIIGPKNIHGEIGKILYIENGVERSYYPDFYIKSTNTIYEVKSTWTYEKWKERNECKKQACLKKGHNFKFIILKNENTKYRI